MQEKRLIVPGQIREYAVSVGSGLLQNAGALLGTDVYSKVFIVTDVHVEKLWFDKLRKGIRRYDGLVSLPTGEQEKHIENVQRIWSAMREAGCDRKSLVIIMGGGVVGDMAAFAAATYMRGVAFVQVPTTLVAQVDSSVGGKTGFDFDGIKNLIGAFAQPTAVLIDTDTLASLPERELVAGFAEMFKHGLIRDAEYFTHLSQKPPKDYTAAQLADFIARSVRLKSDVVAMDEREAGERKIVNFGHTVGHAIEALSWETKQPLLHGEAVAIGMVVEAELSQFKGYISAQDVQRIRQVFSAAGLPTVVPRYPLDKMFEKMAMDKKNEHGKVLFTLLKHIGDAVYNETVNEDVLRRTLQGNMEPGHAS